MPRVSIVLPTYNAGTYLAELISSVLAQTFEDFEFLILDSASSDNTVEIIRSFDDPRITLTELPIVCEAAIKRNLGFAQAQGDFIAMMDADDVLAADRFAKQVVFLDANPEVHVVGSSFITFEEGKDDIPVTLPTQDAGIKANFLTAVGNGIHSPTVMMRRDFMMEKSLYFQVVTAGEGQLFWNDWMKAGAKFANLPDFLVRYRKHDDSHARVRQQAYRPARTLIREELLTLFYPHMTRSEARLVAKMMEKGREHDITELASGVTIVEKLAEFSNCGYGADRNRVMQILAEAHTRARQKMKRVLDRGTQAFLQEQQQGGA